MGLHLLCCWPGLAPLWYRGLPRALLLAVLFSWACCLLMLATFVWPQWWEVWLVRLGWLGLLVFWLTSAVHSHLALPRLLGTSDAQADTTLRKAQREYLQGNWFDAEALLLDILQRNPRDAAATLLLVGVLKQTLRWQAALRRLDHLETLDTSGPWTYEIGRERQLINRRLAEMAEPAVDAQPPA